MKYILLIIISLQATLFIACNSVQSPIADWGKTKYYSDFWWEHYVPVKMEQTLILEFNDDAQKLFTEDAVFELVVKNANGQYQPTQKMILYKNNILCEGNRLRINKNDHEIVIGVEFLPEMSDGCYTLYLNPIEMGGLNRVEQIELQNGFNVQKITVMNPLAKKTMWITIAVIVSLIVWIIGSRIINPNLKFSKISFDYNDGGGEIYRRVGGCYKIICTNTPKKISIFHRIFIGNIFVEVNEFWEQELSIKCGTTDNLRLITRGDYILPDETIRKEMFVIKNDKQQIVNIETT